MNLGEQIMIGDEKLREYLTHQRFRYWLRSQPVEAVVGVAGESMHCPLANYLHYKGLLNAQVGERHIDLFTEGFLTEHPLPAWCRIFVTKVDLITGVPRRSEITAEIALRVLQEVAVYFPVPDEIPEPVEPVEKDQPAIQWEIV